MSLRKRILRLGMKETNKKIIKKKEKEKEKGKKEKEGMEDDTTSSLRVGRKMRTYKKKKQKKKHKKEV